MKKESFVKSSKNDISRSAPLIPMLAVLIQYLRHNGKLLQNTKPNKYYKFKTRFTSRRTSVYKHFYKYCYSYLSKVQPTLKLNTSSPWITDNRY